VCVDLCGRASGCCDCGLESLRITWRAMDVSLGPDALADAYLAQIGVDGKSNGLGFVFASLAPSSFHFKHTTKHSKATRQLQPTY
jgi:hypothetical protein